MKKPKLSTYYIVLIVLAVLAIVLLSATLIVRAVDAEWWIRNISRPLRSISTTISNAVSFSITEIIIYLLIAIGLILIATIVALLVKKKFKLTLRIVTAVLTIVLVVSSLYVVTASCEYGRDELTGEWQNATATKEEFLAIAQAYQKEYNQLAESFERDEQGNIIPQYTFSEIAQLVRDEVAKYADGDYLSSTVAMPKEVLSSKAMSYLGISGMYLSLTGEANINTVTHYTSLPITMAHELAHSLQIMRETDANIFAFYVCLGSQNPYIRYSALQYGYSQLRNGVLSWYTTDSQQFLSLYDGLSPLVLKDRADSYAVWDEYQGWISDLSEFFNDIYLKLSGVTTGTDSYIVPGATIIPQPPTMPDQEPIYVVEFSAVQKIFIYRAER